MDSNYIRVAAVHEVPRRGGKKIYLNGKKIALFRYDDQIYALQNHCPHQGADLAEGYVHDGKIHCMLHDWSFDVKTGSYSFNELLRLKTYTVKVENDSVFIEWKE